MHEILEKISAIGIVPVIKIDDPETAVPLAKALCEGGLPCAEITFRTAQAEESIRRIAQAVPDMLVGAGTVLTTDQVDRAVSAGAKFIVSPGLNPRIVQYCLDKNVPITPGTATPSDIERALELGLDVVKFFPAEVNGGIKAIKAMAALYTQVKFMPTGGVNAKNLNDYLSFDKIIKKTFYDTYVMTGRQRSEFSSHLPRSVYFSYNDSFFLSGFTERIF